MVMFKTGRATLRPVVLYHQSVAHWHYTIWRCFWGSGHSPYDARRYWSYDRSYDRPFMATTSRTIFPHRCWSRDHAYDQSYDDLPPARKTDRSMRPLLEIVANIADRSRVRQIATDWTIRCDCGFTLPSSSYTALHSVGDFRIQFIILGLRRSQVCECLHSLYGLAL